MVCSRLTAEFCDHHDAVGSGIPKPIQHLEKRKRECDGTFGQKFLQYHVKEFPRNNASDTALPPRWKKHLSVSLFGIQRAS